MANLWIYDVVYWSQARAVDRAVWDVVAGNALRVEHDIIGVPLGQASRGNQWNLDDISAIAEHPALEDYMYAIGGREAQ